MSFVFASVINSLAQVLTCETVPGADAISGEKIVCMESITTTDGNSFAILFKIPSEF